MARRHILLYGDFKKRWLSVISRASLDCLVREDQKSAIAPVRKLQRNIAIWGAAFAALAAFARMGAWPRNCRGRYFNSPTPLRRCGCGHQLEFPQVSGYQEARVLSQSLRSLVAELGAQKASLAAANQSLESQVRERTLATRGAEHRLGASKGRRRARDRGEIAISGRGEP